MVQLVRIHPVAAANQRRHDRQVGHEAGRQHHGRVDALELGQALFERDVQTLRTGNAARTAGADTERGDSCRGGSLQRRRSREVKVIVGAQVQYGSTIYGQPGTLGAVRDSRLH